MTVPIPPQRIARLLCPEDFPRGDVIVQLRSGGSLAFHCTGVQPLSMTAQEFKLFSDLRSSIDAYNFAEDPDA